MKRLRQIYNKCISFLSNHAKIAFILSHGGLHLVVLVILIILAFILYQKSKTSENVAVNHVTVFFDSSESDTIGNASYQLKSLACNVNLSNYYSNKNDYFNFNFEVVKTSELLHYNNDSIIDNKEHEIYYAVQSNYGVIYNNGNPHKYQKNDRFGGDIILKNKADYEIPINFEIYNKNKGESPTSVFFLELATGNMFDEHILKNYQGRYNQIYRNLRVKIELGVSSTQYQAIEIKYVNPQPDVITPFGIEYNRRESIDQILLNKGIYVVYDDINVRNESNRKSFQYSILIGTILTFLLDIIVNLILKWKRLANRLKRK